MFETPDFNLRKTKMSGDKLRNKDLSSCPKILTFANAVSFSVTLPKFVWIRLGNCSTTDVETLLRAHHEDLISFDQDEQGTFLALG